jgi:hypothetical protein
MRRLIVLCTLCAGLLITLSGCFRDFFLENTETKEEYDGIKTYVRFINEGKFPVDVFPSSTRDPSTKICSVAPYGGNRTVEAIPNTHANIYYLIHYMNFHGVSLAYNKQFMSLNVPAEQTTNGPIPLLSELSQSAQQERITGDVYIYVNNTSSHSLSLQRGGTPIKLDGSNSPVLNGKSRGVYILPEAQLTVENHTFYRNTSEPLPWPDKITALTSFEKGHLYSFTFSLDTLNFIGDWEMTIANALDQAQ